MAEPDRTNADAERVSDIVARLRSLATEHRTGAVNPCGDTLSEAADIIEAQSKALAEARATAIEECALVCDAEARKRAERMKAADAGDQSWGPDTAKAALAHGHKAVTASGLAADIRALLTPTPENPNG